MLRLVFVSFWLLVFVCCLFVVGLLFDVVCCDLLYVVMVCCCLLLFVVACCCCRFVCIVSFLYGIWMAWIYDRERNRE